MPATLKSGSSCLVLLCLLLLSCAAKTTRPKAEHQVAPARPTLPAERVRVIAEADRPTLQLVHRSGDPKGAVAGAIHVSSGSVGSLHLAAMLRARLAPDFPRLELRTHQGGVIVATEVDTPQLAAQFVESFRQAILRPVEREESENWQDLAFLTAATSRSGPPSPFGLCMGEIGAEGNEALTAALERRGPKERIARLEKYRKKIGAAHIGLSALGDQELLDSVVQGHRASWPRAPQLPARGAAGRQLAVVMGGGAAALRIGLWLTDAETALSAGRLLRDPQHSFPARLEALSSHFSLARTEVALQPGGACLGVTLLQDALAEEPPPLELAGLIALSLEELTATTTSPPAADSVSRSLLAPSTAIEGAALAAWTAVAVPRQNEAPAQVIEYRLPEPKKTSPAELLSLVERVQEEWKSQQIEAAVRLEQGQAELWMLLASPCGTAGEPSEQAGLRALTVASVAANFSGRDGVELAPFVAQDGIGVLAHAGPRRGESHAALARRVARSLGATLVGEALDGRSVAELRARQLQRLGSDPGLSLLTEVLGGEHTSMLQPLGNEGSVATLSTADVERTRGDLSREPLRVAILANAGPEQATEATQALSAWLAPGRSAGQRCTRGVAQPSAPGIWRIESISEATSPRAYVAAWAPGPAQLGHATAYLLNEPGGLLDRALVQEGLVAHAEASFLGGSRFGALLVRVAAEEAQLEAAVAQTRALLARLGEGALDNEAIARAAAEFQRRTEASERRPAGRLVRLWLSPPTASLTPTALHEYQTQLRADQHRVVYVKQRR